MTAVSKEWGCRGVRAYGVWGGLRRAARTRMSRAGWRLRTRWRSVLSRGARLTGATVAAFVAAELVGLRDPPPLIAALTALLVVEATLASTLVSGLQRVLSVVAVKQRFGGRQEVKQVPVGAQWVIMAASPLALIGGHHSLARIRVGNAAAV